MASLTARNNSPYWCACFTDLNGRALKKTTKVRRTPLPGDSRKSSDLKREAQAIANKFEEAARTKRTTDQTRRVIAEMHTLLSRETLHTRSVREQVDVWLARKSHEVGPRTYGFYKSSATKFLAWLGAAANDDVNLLSRAILTDYRNHLAKTLHPVSVNHDLVAVKSLCTDARRDGVLEHNPAEFVARLPKPKNNDIRRPFTKGEMAAILKQASPEWRSMIVFGIYTGQRLGDLVTLPWSGIDLNLGVIKLTTGKTGRMMQIPIAGPLRARIEELSRDSDLVHPGIARMAESSRSNQFAEILRKAGLRTQKPHVKKEGGGGRSVRRTKYELSFHCLRHTAVTLLKEAGVPAAIVMEIIGHDSATISQHYTHIGVLAMGDALSKMPDITQA